MDHVKLIFKSSKNWADIAKADDLVNIFISEGDFVVPEKFDQCEPERYAFIPTNYTKLREFWSSKTPSALFKRKQPYASWLNFTILFEKRFNEILAGFDARYFEKDENIKKLLSFSKRLYSWGNVDHGYICHDTDWQAKNRFESPVIIDGKPMMGGGHRLNQSLPGVYWVNFFGPVYVEFLGKEKFISLPCYYKEKLQDGGFMVMTARSPFDYEEPETKKLEKEIIEQLGHDTFFDKRKPARICRVPLLMKEYR